MSEFLEQIHQYTYNIWRYSNFYTPAINPEFQLTLEEGWTKCVKFQDILPGVKLILKREDLNPAGSHKARSLAYQISHARMSGEKAVVISSSGNAAVAAAAYCSLAGIHLIAFLAPTSHPHKIEEVNRLGATTILTDRAINSAKYVTRAYGLTNLRPSTNDLSIEGFKSIAFELYEQVGPVDAIFTWVSSASSLIAIGRAYSLLVNELNVLEQAPRLYAVQGGNIQSLAREFGNDIETVPGEDPLAGRHGVKKTRRLDEAVQMIRESGGSALAVSNQEVLEALRILNQHGIDTSLEGAGSLAAALKTPDLAGQRIVCILTGHASQLPEEALQSEVKRTHSIQNPDELDALLHQLGLKKQVIPGISEENDS